MRPYSMVDEILIILLAVGAVLLIAQWLLFHFYVKKDRYWNTPTKKQQAEMRQLIYDYLYRNPASIIRNDYPHLADAAEATRAYEHLNQLYKEGLIDEIDYNNELEKLLPKINIEQDF